MANAEFVRPLAVPPVGAVWALGTASGTMVDHIGNDHRGMIYESAGGVDSGHWRYDFGHDVLIDRVMLFGVAGAPATARISVLYATAADGGAIWTGSVPPVPLYAGDSRLSDGTGVSYLKVTAPPARYWWFSFDGLGGARMKIGRLVMGKAYVPQRNFSFGAGYGVRDFANVDFSARGVLLRRGGPKLRTVTLDLPMAWRDEAEESVLPMLEALGGDNPIALITDPAPHPMRERRCYFGLLTGDLGMVWRTPKAWEWRASMVSLF